MHPVTAAGTFCCITPTTGYWKPGPLRTLRWPVGEKALSATAGLAIRAAPTSEPRPIMTRVRFILLLLLFANDARGLQRDVVVLLPRVLELLVAQHLERPGDALARAVRHDHLVDIAAFRRHERVGEALLIVVDALLDLGLVAKLGAIQDLCRALGAHHRDLGRRPSIVHV